MHADQRANKLRWATKDGPAPEEGFMGELDRISALQTQPLAASSAGIDARAIKLVHFWLWEGKKPTVDEGSQIGRPNSRPTIKRDSRARMMNKHLNK